MMKRTSVLVSVFLLLTVTAAGVARTQGNPSVLVEPEVYARLASSPDGRTYVVVMLRPVSTPPSLDEVREAQEAALSTLSSGEFQLVYQYKNVAALTGYVNADGLSKLALSPYVAAVGLDARCKGTLDVSVPFINADDVQALGYTGDGITVAVLDTGIDSDHPDLSDNVASGWYHFLLDSLDVGPGAEDDNGHGTNVSGIITSKGDVASVGVAPDADILAIKVLGSDGSGSMSDVARGVDYVVEHKDDYTNLCAINISIGSYRLFYGVCDDSLVINQVLQASILAAKNAGIVTFASSGNDGSCVSMSSPACLSAAVAVAAVYDQNLGREPDSGTYQDIWSSFGDCFDGSTSGDKITCFSNRLDGCNELAAPGRLIDAPRKGGGTSAYTGTSQASPHCAGVAALMCDKFVGLTPDQLVQVMKNKGVATNDPCGTSPNPIRVNALPTVNALDETVFSNTKTSTGIHSAGGAQHGSEITLAGTYRSVKELLIGLYNNSPQYCDLKARIYKNDGPGGKPGTLLWESEWQNEWIPTEHTLISFDVGCVSAPETITWTLESRDCAFYPNHPHYGPATVGSYVTSWWGDGSNWTEQPGDNYMVRVNAAEILAPTLSEWGLVILLLLLLATASVFIRRRQRVRVAED